MSTGPKDSWDKLAVVVQPLGGLLTAAAVGMVGFMGSQVIERRQSIDTNARLYSELMSRREESESGLRKDMFVSIIGTFLLVGSMFLVLDTLERVVRTRFAHMI